LTISASATKDLNPPSVEWQSRTFSWHAKPTVVSISPASGGSAGGTDVVVRGSGFLPGSKATLDGVQLFPGGGIIMEGNEFILSGHVPAHSAGSATLVVHTPLGDSPSLSGAFTYLDPPLLLKIEPNTDGTAGGSPVTLTGQGFDDQTQIYFGQTLESAVSLLDSVCTSATTILGRTPPGTGQTTVWAFAPALGWTKLVAEFSWMTP
jgi:hypothetical protein